MELKRNNGIITKDEDEIKEEIIQLYQPLLTCFLLWIKQRIKEPWARW